MKMRGRVLIVAGSDSGGGAGIQADIKTVTALGGYAATAVTAVTVQDTTGVHDIHTVPTDIIAAQMRAVLRDIGADAVKTGMLHSREVIETVADVLDEEAPKLPLVVDPVMVAKGGARLLAEEATEALVSRLLPLAALVTPNAPELAALAERSVETAADLAAAAGILREQGAQAVLAKGGHLEEDENLDLLLSDAGERRFPFERIKTRHTHGTGCTLASAVAVGIAQGLEVEAAVARALDYTRGAIRRAPGFGRGHGPLDHGHPCRE